MMTKVTREVSQMSIDPITYKPWSGERTSHLERVWVMALAFFRQKLRSKWILLLLILGILLIYIISMFVYALTPHETLEASTMAGQMGQELFFIFTILLVAMICSDTIAEDLRSNSFVLYFSRAMKTESYLAGKIGGAFLTLSVFCFFPPIVLAIAVMGTQSSSSYGESLGVLGRTVIAGLVTTFFFIPFGLFISSLTKRKSYASVGTFMSFFILMIVGEIFSEFNQDWELINPGRLFYYFSQAVFGLGLPSSVNVGLLTGIFLAFMLVPLFLVYLLINKKAVGG